MAEPSADAELGDAAYGESKSMTYEADETITAGDAVTIDSTNQLLQAANSNDTNGFIVGIAAEDGEDGDNITVYTSGLIVANVASGVTAGEELAASTTDGQLGTGTGGIVAVTDAGGVAGLSAGYGLGSNAAVVEV